ncbi:MAG: hypothetical protein SNF93_00545 [Rikenellaceae bacterium]
MKRAALLCCTCYVVLLCVSIIPPQTVCGVELRRANVLSDVVWWHADNLVEDIELVIDTQEYEVDLEHVEQQVVALDDIIPTVASNFEWSELEKDTVAITQEQMREHLKQAKPSMLLEGIDLTPIECYDTLELSAISRLYRKLLSPDSLVRIAFLGDSFVEADIVTADLREALQNEYGGIGAGFAPMHSDLMQYRQTIKTASSGWRSYNIMQHRKTPAPYNSYFSVSGWVSAPSTGAVTTWTTTSVRDNIGSCDRVRLHFMALDDCKIEVTINGGESRTFEIKADSNLRQIELAQSGISKVSMRVLSGASGFIGYGAIFEGESGVVVDNYSVRSNNGQAMFWSSAAVNAQIDRRIGGYDLVVLQYGLNIMQSGVNRYTSYAVQVEKMISYVQKCFPNAAVLVMGVSDRSMKSNGIYQPMSEAESLTDYQRQAAKAMGVCFWPTLTAMQAQGGMSKFVSNGWAAKDFTHINFKGGQRVAYALVDAISAGVEREREKMVNKIEYEAIIDSVSTKILDNRLLKKSQVDILMQGSNVVIR